MTQMVITATSAHMDPMMVSASVVAEGGVDVERV